MRTLLRARRSVLWLGDALFSVYVALLVFFRESGRDHSVFLQTLEHPLAIVNRALDRPFDFSATFDGTWHIQVAAAVLLAVIILACVRACRWTRLTRAAVRYGVGLIAAVGPLYSPHFDYFENSLWYDTIVVWTRIEVAMVAAYAVLYLHAKWAARSDLAVGVLALHLSFWGAVVWGGAWGGSYWRLLALLLLPLGTLLCWGYDVRQSGAPPSSVAPAPASGG